MNHPWAICLKREDASSLAPLRLMAGVEIGEAGDQLWLRGKATGEVEQRRLLALPATGRFELLPGNQLRAVEARIPSAKLPELKWQPIAAWLRIVSPAVGLPAQEPQPIPLRLVRANAESEPDLLLTELSHWRDFVRAAPLVRLEKLRFAADADGRILVRGTPLPPLPGQRYVVRAGLAVPAGFHWVPAVDVEVLVRRFGVAGGTLVVWHEDNTVTRLHAEQFVSATRSAVRATAEALTDQS